MKISIVTTMYYSAPYIREFYTRAKQTVEKITKDYEIIFVDDGSPDESFTIAIDIANQDEKVKVIELSRNFGHHKAMMTGLMRANGDYIFLIDIDLEEEPEWLELFWSEMQKEKNIDVVYGQQIKRKGHLFEKISGEIFYWLFNKIGQYKMPKNPVTARLMNKNYKDALIQHTEKEVFLLGIWAITGFNQKAIPVRKHSHSTTTYSLSKKISLFVNAMLSFSVYPLKLIFNMGFIISTFSFIYIAYIIYRKIFYGAGLMGWSSLIASIWFLGGLTLLSIGIVGGYLAKVFIETKPRPYTIIRKIYQKKDNQNE